MSEDPIDPVSQAAGLVVRLAGGALAMGIGGYMSVEALRLLSRFNPEGILLLIFGVAIFCVPFKQLLDL